MGGVLMQSVKTTLLWVALCGHVVLAPCVQAAKSMAWPDTYSVRTVTLASPLKTLELVTFEGKALVGPTLRTLPNPEGRPHGEYYAEMAEAYVTLLAVIARQRKEPAYLKPALGDPAVERRLWDFALQFLTPEAQARYLACPSVPPGSAAGCKARVDGTLSPWRGDDEFAKEDSFIAFGRDFEKAALSSQGKLPLDLWHLYALRLPRYDAHRQSFTLDRPDKIYRTLPKNVYTTTLIGISPFASPAADYPRQIEMAHEPARALIESAPDRKAVMLVPLHFPLETQSPETSVEDQRLRAGAARLYASPALRRLLYRFEQQ